MTPRCVGRQLRRLAEEFIGPLRRDIVPLDTPSTRFPGRSLKDKGEFAAALKETLGFPPYALSLPDPQPEDALGAGLVKYLRWVGKCWPRALAERATWTQPMNPDCKISLSIAVAAHNEELVIYNTIRQLQRLDADPRSYEACLFVNVPKVRDDGSPVALDGTIEQINQGISDFRELPLRWRFVQYDRPARIGTIRLHSDASIFYRHMQRQALGAPVADHLVLRTDADVIKMHPRLIRTYLREAEQHPEVQLFRGQIDYDRRVALCSARDLVCLRVEDAIRSLLWAKGQIDWYRGGANCMYRMSAYLAVGGYRPWLDSYEDVDLGTRILRHFGGREKPAFKVCGAGTRIYTSARRNALTVRNGYAALMAWSNKESQFLVDDPKVRSWKPVPQSDEDFEKELGAENFAFEISGILTQIMRFTVDRDQELFRETATRVLSEALGLPIFFSERTGVVIIKDAEALKALLRLWRAIEKQHAE